MLALLWTIAAAGADSRGPPVAIRGCDLLASWAAHDLLHLRQLVELHWAYKEEQVQPYSTLYAGEW